MLKIEENWAAKKFVIICLASVVPFGTFYVENKYFKNNDEKEAARAGSSLGL
jgi:hypothetical protein